VEERELREAFHLAAQRGGIDPELRARFANMKSQLRSSLNGLEVNRAKYTSYSRHYTSGRVLSEIARTVQPMLQAGDTFVDFACGQNSFGSMLVDPATRQPLASRSFDVLSPVDKTHDFCRRNWFAVSASELPPGELIIGLNPPFGHNNKTAIEFVKHAVCMRPRLLVLIMPATNYMPEGYELVHHDDQLCRGFAFYVPGSVSSNLINAKHVHPAFYVYERRPGMPGPQERLVYCDHRAGLRRKLIGNKRRCELAGRASWEASEDAKKRLAAEEERAKRRKV